MKKLIKLKEQIDNEKTNLLALYGIDYIYASSYSITINKNGIELTSYKHYSKPKIKTACANTQPETYDEFEAVKAKNEADIQTLIEIYNEWKRIINED